MPAELPPKRNGPVSIKEASPPGPRIKFYNGSGCPTLNPSFQLKVRDEDLADLTFSRWFIGGTNTQPFVPSSVQGGSAQREVNAPFALKTTLANLTVGLTEILTVYVADTDFEVLDGKVAYAPGARDRVLPDGTPVTDLGSYDTFTWTLDMDACP